VTVLERYKDVGGAAFSEEIEGAPGHIASTGSYVLSLAPKKILADFDLLANGVEMIKRDPRSVAPLMDVDEGVVFWVDLDDLCREFALFS
jgi:phytoene dehydrogenase-like protein